DILDVALGEDVHTPVGLTRLSRKLGDEAAKLEKKRAANPSIKLAVLATAFHKLAVHVGPRGGGPETAPEVLHQGETLMQGDLKQQATDPAARFKLAEIRAERGVVLSDLGDTEAARKDLESALTELEGLRKAKLDELDFRRLQAEALHNLAVLLAGET